MVRTVEDILAALEANKDEIRSFSVTRLALFGSFARGEPSAESDFDFLVAFEKKSFDAYMDLKAFLEDLLGRPVDLVLANTIKPRLREHISRELIDVPGL